MILQKTTAATADTNVAISPGAITAVGDTLPYWLRYAIIFTGINCRDAIFIIRNTHISLLAVRSPSFFPFTHRSFLQYSGFPRSSSSFDNSSIAFNPAGVAAQPSPSTFAMILVLIASLAGCPLGILGNIKLTNGLIFLVITSIKPLVFAISISPIQKEMTPSMVRHSVIASLEESSAAFVTSAIFPVRAA